MKALHRSLGGPCDPCSLARYYLVLAVIFLSGGIFAMECVQVQALIDYCQEHHLRRRLTPEELENKANLGLINSTIYFSGFNSSQKTMFRRLIYGRLKEKTSSPLELIHEGALDCELPDIVRDVLKRTEFTSSDDDIWRSFVQGYLVTLDPHSEWLPDNEKETYFSTIAGSNPERAQSEIIPSVDSNDGTKQTLKFKIGSITDTTGSVIQNQIERSRPSGLVLDLTESQGGSFLAVNNILALFGKGGVVATVWDRNDQEIEAYRIHGTGQPIYEGMPIVVYIGPKTTSSAEVLAESLRQLAGAILIGKKTYGKATIAESTVIANKTYMITKYLTRWANGNTYHHRGIEPDIELGDLHAKKTKREKHLPFTLMIRRHPNAEIRLALQQLKTKLIPFDSQTFATKSISVKSKDIKPEERDLSVFGEKILSYMIALEGNNHRLRNLENVVAIISK